ncbi:UNVERIFIED_CONTAM: hypothetical protein NCL1_11655 [Trichonephila clavipes]
MEERRSIHSLHSLRSSRSHPKQLSDISYIDEDVKTPSPNDKRNHTPDGETAPLMVTSPGSTSSGSSSLTNNNRLL